MSSNPSEESRGSSEEANKRAALAGQWRTPPLPTFAAGYGQPTQAPAPAPAAPRSEDDLALPNPTSIPSSSEDYAKALQEAYRKGAEAAARMAQQQQQIPSAASCPNFQQASPQLKPLPQPISQTIPEEAAYTAQIAPPPPVPDPLTSMPPPPPPQAAAPPSETSMPPPPQPNRASSNPQSRSVSLPDMSAYAVQAEEEKRQKRLARNRASARLRRLRKKNLVDAYETEVGILERTLKKLEDHEWGVDDNHKALLDAIGMERGQQAISPEQRKEIIQDILKQQMQQVELLRQSQLEQECLAMLAEDQDDELSRELQDVLNLSEEQKAELRESSKGLEGEVEALETISASLQAMQENEWLLNQGVQGITDQFTSILHPNQLSKFLLWTDANAEAIDQLDHVTVQPLQTAPIFSFGVEASAADDDEK